MNVSDADNTIRFVWSAPVIAARDVSPTTTLLQYCAETLGRTGTKEAAPRATAAPAPWARGTRGARIDERRSSCIRFLRRWMARNRHVESLKAPTAACTGAAAMVDCTASHAASAAGLRHVAVPALCEQSEPGPWTTLWTSSPAPVPVTATGLSSKPLRITVIPERRMSARRGRAPCVASSLERSARRRASACRRVRISDTADARRLRLAYEAARTRCARPSDGHRCGNQAMRELPPLIYLGMWRS